MSQRNTEKKVLIVDDEALIAMYGASVLKKHGYEVLTAHSGKNAIDAAAKHDIDLVLMDIDLGKDKMDGTEAAAEILREHDIPVVFLSSHTEPEIVEKTEKITSYGYVVKNSSETVLLASIKMAFRLHDAYKIRKKSEKVLRESEEKFRSLAENTIDWIWQVDTTGRYTYVGPEVQEIFGYTPEEIVGKTPFDFMDEAEARRVAGIFKPLADRGERIIGLEDTLRHKNGHTVIFETNATPLFSDTGEFKGYFGTCRDISERKEMESALRGSKEQFRVLLELSPVGIYQTDKDGNYVYANPRWLEMAGMSMDEAKGRGWMKGLHPDDRETIGEKWYKSVRSNGSWGYEYRFQTPGGKITWVYGNARAMYGERGEVTAYIGTNLDITERKKKEEELEKNEALLNEAQEMANIGSFVWDLQTDSLEWSRNMFAIAGLDSGSFRGNLQETISTMLHPEDRERVFEQIEEMVKQKKTWPMEFRLVRPDGDIRWLRSGSRFITDEKGVPVINVGIHRDFTDQKKVLEGLRESRIKFQTIVQTTMDGFLQVDTKGRILDVNNTLCMMSGYGREELLGMTIAELEAKEDPEEVAEHMKRLVREGSSRFESVHCRKDGTVYPVEVSSTYVAEGDGIFLSFLRDVSDEKRAEEELCLNTARLESILRLNEMKRSDPQKLAEFALEESQRLTRSEVGFINFLSEDERLVTRTFYTKNTHKQCGLPKSVEAFTISECGLWSEAYRKRKPVIVNDYSAGHPAKRGLPEGHLHFSRFMSVPVFEGKRVVAIAALGNKKTDYTETDVRQFRLLMDGLWQIMQRRETADKLLESEAQKDIILNSSAEMIAYYDTDLRIIWANRAAAESVGKTPGELPGLHCYEIWHQRSGPCEGCPVLKARETGEPEESEQKTADGRYWSIRGYPVLDKDGTVTALVEFGQDISGRRESEEKLRESVREKEYLMAELNHRVKNNLAVISSLISLKNDSIGDNIDLSDIKFQIDAVRIVHEKLYRSSDITQINIGDYIQDLLVTIFSSFTRRRVTVENTIGDISLPTKTAVSIGLIVNEIATNAIKYGFTEEEEALFTVDLRKNDKENEYVLFLSNSGRPFPEDIDLDNPDTLGLRLISALTEQLNGTIELNRAPEPEFTIRFPADN